MSETIINAVFLLCSDKINALSPYKPWFPDVWIKIGQFGSQSLSGNSL